MKWGQIIVHGYSLFWRAYFTSNTKTWDRADLTQLQIDCSKFQWKSSSNKNLETSFKILDFVLLVEKLKKIVRAKNELEWLRWRSYLDYKSNEFITIWFHLVHIILIIKSYFSITRPLFFQNIVEHSNSLF